jgi:hypothetical protein
VLAVILLAKLASETIVSGIAPGARLRTAWLCPLLRVPHGRIPCANTSPHRCAKVAIADLNRRLAACFVPPLPPLPETAAPSAADPPAPAPHAQRHLALDGKTLPGTCRGNVVQPAVPLLSLYDVTHQGTRAQAEAATKDHVLPGAAPLIAGRDLHGCVITADAFHPLRTWCRTVRAQGTIMS